MDIALAATQPVAAAYDAASHGYATAADYRLLAYYSWGQDRERLVSEEHLPDALRNLQDRIPDDELAVERGASRRIREPTLPAEERFWRHHYLLAYDPPAAASEPRIAHPEPTLPGGKSGSHRRGRDQGRRDESRWRCGIVCGCGTRALTSSESPIDSARALVTLSTTARRSRPDGA